MDELGYMHLGEGLDIQYPVKEGKRFGIAGKSGSGKTNSMLWLAQLMLKAGWLVWIIEPMNNFRHLRTAGLPIMVAGGNPSADVQLSPSNAAELARMCFDERLSAVLTLSAIKNDMAVLVPFLETLWEERILRQPEDGPFVRTALFIDESDLYIPQSGKTEVSDILIDMGKRGRQLHLSMAVASQRPASMDKNFLTQSNVMLYHRLKGRDIVSLKEEIGLPERYLQTMMRKFVNGDVLLEADADMVEMGEEDYLRGHVPQWTGAQTSTTASEGIQRVGGIDPKLMDKIRKALTTEKPAPKPSAMVPVADNQLAGKVSQLEATNQRAWRTVTALLSLNQQFQRLNKQWVEIAERDHQQLLQIQTENKELRQQNKGQIVQQRMTIPGLEIEGEISENGKVTVTRKTVHVETVESSYQSSRQLATKIRKQESGFGDLLKSLKSLVPYLAAILLETMTRTNGMVSLDEVAREYDYAYSSLYKGAYLVTRTGLASRMDSGEFYSVADQYLQDNFPVLNPRELKSRILDVLEDRLENSR